MRGNCRQSARYCQLRGFSVVWEWLQGKVWDNYFLIINCLLYHNDSLESSEHFQRSHIMLFLGSHFYLNTCWDKIFLFLKYLYFPHRVHCCSTVFLKHCFSAQTYWKPPFDVLSLLWLVSLHRPERAPLTVCQISSASVCSLQLAALLQWISSPEPL